MAEKEVQQNGGEAGTERRRREGGWSVLSRLSDRVMVLGESRSAVLFAPQRSGKSARSSLSPRFSSSTRLVYNFGFHKQKESFATNQSRAFALLLTNGESVLSGQWASSTNHSTPSLEARVWRGSQSANRKGAQPCSFFWRVTREGGVSVRARSSPNRFRPGLGGFLGFSSSLVKWQELKWINIKNASKTIIQTHLDNFFWLFSAWILLLCDHLTHSLHLLFRFHVVSWVTLHCKAWACPFEIKWHII